MPEPEEAENMSDSEPQTGNKSTSISTSGSRQAFLAVSDGILGAGLLIMIGVWGGNILDDRFHTAPWISLVLSISLGALGLARLVSKANQFDSGKLPPKQKEH